MMMKRTVAGRGGRTAPPPARLGVRVSAIAAPPERPSQQQQQQQQVPKEQLKKVPRLPGQLPYAGALLTVPPAKLFMHVAETERKHSMRMAEVELMGRTAVRLRHPEDIARVMAKECDVFVKAESDTGALADWLANGLATNRDASHHAAMREVMMPAFRAEAVRSYCGTFTDVADSLASLLLESEGEALNIEPLMQRATLDVIGLAGFGYDFRAVAMGSKGYKPPAPAADSPTSDGGDPAAGGAGARDVDVGAVWSGMMAPAMLLGLMLPVPESWVPGADSFRRGVATLDRVAYHMMDEHRAGRVAGNRKSILAHLMDAQAAGNALVTDKQVRDELQTLMLAGSDTTATTLAFAAWELSRRPELRARVVAEVDAAMAGRDGPVVAEDVQRMPLLGGVINEALRLYSAAPNTRRVAARDAELGGYAIPQGTSVILDLWAMHRHEDFWPQPDDFVPDRWLPANAPTMAPHASTAFMPFSVGPRSCVGRYFAVLEAQVILAQLLRRVSLGAAPGGGGGPEGEPMGLAQQLTLASERGIYVVPAARRR